MPRFLTALLILILLSACTPAPTTAPTLTATITLQPPTATNIPPTPTVTPVPTQSPEQVADGLGLRSGPLYGGRGFEYREAGGATYLVDGYNDVPKAVLQEDGTWSKLDYTNPGDAELMYGRLVPEGGEYIDSEQYHTSEDGEYKRVTARFLGDWEVRPMEYGGGEISLYYLLAGLRDGGGGLHVVRLAFEAPDAPPEHRTLINCSYVTDDGGFGSAGIWSQLENLLPRLRAGEEMWVEIWETARVQEGDLWQSPDNPLVNSARSIVMRGLYNDYPQQFQMSAEERSALESYGWPDRPVTLALINSLKLNRGSIEECRK